MNSYLLKKINLQAGDLFTISDDAIVNDLSEVINIICEITSFPDYVNNDNDQSVVEICITRVTTAIRYYNLLFYLKMYYTIVYKFLLKDNIQFHNYMLN